MTNRIAATLLVASALAALPWPAHAARIAAACEAPVGWRFEHGIEMPLVDDRLSARPVIVWEEGASEALVILETGISEAASPWIETAQVLQATPERLTLLLAYDRAVAIYSVYLGAETLILSVHTRGEGDHQGAAAKLLRARCRIMRG